MIKLVIEIEEKNSIETSKYKTIGANVHITEIGQKATKSEIDISKILKDRLKVEEPIQIENYSQQNNDHLKEDLLELLKRL